MDTRYMDIRLIAGYKYIDIKRIYGYKIYVHKTDSWIQGIQTKDKKLDTRYMDIKRIDGYKIYGHKTNSWIQVYRHKTDILIQGILT